MNNMSPAHLIGATEDTVVTDIIHNGTEPYEEEHILQHIFPPQREDMNQLLLILLIKITSSVEIFTEFPASAQVSL